MNIIICGAGRVGFTIAKLLSEQGHSITVIDQSSEDIQKINYKFRKINKPTNVLSFPSEELDQIDKNCEGEILICNDLLLEESLAQNKNHIDHFLHLLVHSLLHLKGYGHDNENDAILMEEKEIEFLSQIGISNPYK